MPENERVGRWPKKQDTTELEKKVQELEKVVRSLLLAMKQVEEEIEEYCMPKGEYYGVDFND